MELISARQADPADVPAIFRVRTSVVENHMTEEELAAIGITRQSIAAMLKAGDAKAWCAEVAGEVVAFSLAFREVREISALFVLPDYEQRGIGSRLLTEAVDWLKTIGGGPIRLATDRKTRAYGFYKKRGWVDLGFGPEDRDSGGDIYMQYDPDS